MLIVAASVVGGARLLSAADDTVGVWATGTAHGAGDRLAPEDLSAIRVHFDDVTTSSGYWTVQDTLPAELVLTRGVGPGELLPRAAIGSAADSGLVEVPLAVDSELVPSSVGPGSVVDIYLVASSEADAAVTGGTGGTGGSRAAADPALAAVTVLDAPPLAETFGTGGRRQLVLAVPEDDAPRFFALLGSLGDPAVTVVRRS